MRTGFRNVDLDIESAGSINLLATEMGERVVVLYNGSAGKAKRHLLAMEAGRNFKTPDPAIHAFCAVVESLSPNAKSMGGGRQSD